MHSRGIRDFKSRSIVLICLIKIIVGLTYTEQFCDKFNFGVAENEVY